MFPGSLTNHQPNPKSDLEHLQDERAKNALIAFLGDVALQQREMQAAYLGSPQGVASHIQRPQVFFSYALGELSDPRFIALQTFLVTARAPAKQICHSSPFGQQLMDCILLSPSFEDSLKYDNRL